MSGASPLRIRPAESGDVESLLDLWRTEGVTPSRTDSVSAVQLALRVATAVLVAVESGRVVGALIATFDGWRGNMYRLAVLPSHRRLGIASLLVAEGERRLDAAGARRITALVEAEHDWAVAFWERAGYALDSRIGRWAKTV